MPKVIYPQIEPRGFLSGMRTEEQEAEEGRMDEERASPVWTFRESAGRVWSGVRGVKIRAATVISKIQKGTF